MLMLFHGNRWAMSYEENAHLVCHHAMLAAVSLGLGIRRDLAGVKMM